MAHSKRGRVSSLANIIDSYFMQGDGYEANYSINNLSHSLLSEPSNSSVSSNQSDTTKKERIWQFRQTVSYWISISFIFGSVLFTTGSFFWIIEAYITLSDYYTLVTVAFFFRHLDVSNW